MSSALQMLVRNRVADRTRFRRVFDEQMSVAEESGLTLAGYWHDADDAHTVWFLLDVADRAAAEAYVEDPASAEVGERAGVLDGDYHWLGNL